MLTRKQTLSPRDLAQVVGVSESSLKRWADDGLLQISRTAGGHRRIGLAEAASYIRRSGLPLTDPAPLGLGDLATLSDNAAPGRLDYLLVDAIRNSEQSRAVALTLKLYLSGRSVCEICDGPMKHALRDERHKSAGAGDTATRICLAALDELLTLLPGPSGHVSARVIGDGSAESQLQARMMRTVLTAERWSITETQSVLANQVAFEAGAQKAILVAVPAAVLESREDAATLPELAAALQPLNCRLVLIGGTSGAPTANVSAVESMSEFASLVRCIEAVHASPLH